jgi:2-desacetyl-2-hydroxyethyl bacteriochlorophyllide A dehydrogenase
MKARQVVITEPCKVAVREVELPAPADNQILVQTEASAVSAGTELAVYTGTHQWLKDPTLPDWKFPFRPGYSAAGTVVAVGQAVKTWQPGDRVSYPGNHASHELLTIGHERGRLWDLPPKLDAEKACVACVARYGMGAAIRSGLTLGRSAVVLGLGVIGQFALRSLLAAGAHPVIGIDSVPMRREAALAGGADFALDPAEAARQGEGCQLLRRPPPPLDLGSRRSRQPAFRSIAYAPTGSLGYRQGPELAAGGSDVRSAEPCRPDHTQNPASRVGNCLRRPAQEEG